jgi:hypothetical protein
MISFARFPRTNRALFVISIVCLLTTVMTTVFVGARNGNNETSQTEPAYPTFVDEPVKAKVAQRFGRLPLSLRKMKVRWMVR